MATWRAPASPTSRPHAAVCADAAYVHRHTLLTSTLTHPSFSIVQEDREGRKRSASTGTPGREIVVSVQRDTTVTFEEVFKSEETLRNASRYKSRARL